MNLFREKFNKLILILLIIAAVIVWGNFVVHFIKSFGKTKQDTQQSLVSTNASKIPKQEVTFTGSYRDPFFTNSVQTQHNPDTLTQKVIVPVPRKETTISTSPITLLGIIGTTVIISNNHKIEYYTTDVKTGLGVFHKIDNATVTLTNNNQSTTYHINAKSGNLLDNQPKLK